MKKKLAMMAAALAMIFSLCGCGNYGGVDLNFDYDYAIISLPNGEVVEGEIERWWDYAEGDMIQVKMDGKFYLVHCNDIVLIKE